MQQMWVLHKVEKARKKSEPGKTHSAKEAKKKPAGWVK